MKSLPITLVCILFNLMLLAQVPQGFNYQAVARDEEGKILANESLVVSMSIYSDPDLVNLKYREDHTVRTNQFGLISLIIGKGTPQSGDFSSIDWSSGQHQLKVEVDLGTGLVEIGDSPLLSVPYSLYSQIADKASNMSLPELTDVDTANLISGQLLKWNGAQWVPEPAIFIDNQGKVGVGINTPRQLQHLHAVNKNIFQSYESFTHYTNEETGNTTKDGLIVGVSNKTARIQNKEEGNLIICTGFSREGHLTFGSGGVCPRMTLNANGKLGIGTQSPNSKLQVVGNVTVGRTDPIASPKHELRIVHGSASGGGLTNGLQIENEGNNRNWWAFYTTNSSGELELYYKGGLRGEFDPSDGEYRQRSDARLKRDVQPLPSVLYKVLQLKPSSYYFKDLANPTVKSLGFIAQEVQPLFPELVGYAGEDQDLMTLNYAGFGVLAIKAIQEQDVLIEELMRRIAKLEAQINP